MTRALPLAVVAAVAVLALAQLVVPLSRRFPYLGGGARNPRLDSTATLQAELAPPADVETVLARACKDCHTSNTVWPWYAHVAPASWIVINDVNHGRAHVNYSQWKELPPADKRRLLDNTCKLVADGSMPPRNYLRMHEEARVSEREVQRLCAWTRIAQAALSPP